uniref:Uncharacterized protein n=1 Tax=Timema cristinae TaxID=61476 RepID=A0A7R9CDN6_TIMCR|nr:unnamed protein product [Timema cristinae]
MSLVAARYNLHLSQLSWGGSLHPGTLSPHDESQDPFLRGMGCEITTCSFATATLTSHSQPVPDKTKEAVPFCHWSTDQLHPVTGSEQCWNRSKVTLLLVSGTDSAVIGPGKPCSFMLQRFLEQSYSGKEVDALCSCQCAEIKSGKGGKNRRRGKNENETEKRELVFKEDGQGED